jgi:hypothetical protein
MTLVCRHFPRFSKANDSPRLLCPAAPASRLPGDLPPIMGAGDAKSMQTCGSAPIFGYQARCSVCRRSPDKAAVTRALAEADSAWARGESSLDAGNVPRAIVCSSRTKPAAALDDYLDCLENYITIMTIGSIV